MHLDFFSIQRTFHILCGMVCYVLIFPRFLKRDLEHSANPVYSANAHTSIINDIDGVGGLNVGKGAPELATCGRDGCVKIWDTRQKDRPVAILEPEVGQTRRDCWAVAFGIFGSISCIGYLKSKCCFFLGGAYSSSERLLSAGFDNGDLKIFDLKTMKVHWETNVGNGVLHLVLFFICYQDVDYRIIV